MDLRVFGEKFSIIFEKVANVDFIVVLPGLVLGEEVGQVGHWGSCVAVSLTNRLLMVATVSAGRWGR